MRKFSNLSITSRIIIIVALALVVCLIIAAGVYMYLGSLISGRAYEPDLIISSPDGQYELVIREFSCLGGAGAEIYIREPGQDKWYNRWMEKKVGQASTDDYYLTFTNETFYVEWESDKVTVCYYKGVEIENMNDRSTWRGMVTYDLD